MQVTYKVSVLIAKVCGKRRVSEGAHSVYSGCSCSRQVFTFVLLIVVRVWVNNRSSLYRSWISCGGSTGDMTLVVFTLRYLQDREKYQHINVRQNSTSVLSEGFSYLEYK